MVESNQQGNFKVAYFTAIILIGSAIVSERIREIVINEVSKAGITGGLVLVIYIFHIALLALPVAIPIMALMKFLKM